MTKFIIIYVIEANYIVNFIDDCLKWFQWSTYIKHDALGRCILYVFKQFGLIVRKNYGL